MRHVKRIPLRISKEYEQYIYEKEKIREDVLMEQDKKTDNYTTEINFDINKDITVN